jgi:Rnl2 family RNA ligase
MNNKTKGWFAPYQPIENVYDDKMIDKVYKVGYNRGTCKDPVTSLVSWVVTEKIHGSNFSFITDGKDIRCAKRSALLGSNEEFLNYQFILEKYRSNVLEAYKIVKQHSPDLEVMKIYGELFGGSYPHPDVPAIKVREIMQRYIY